MRNKDDVAAIWTANVASDITNFGLNRWAESFYLVGINAMVPITVSLRPAKSTRQWPFSGRLGTGIFTVATIELAAPTPTRPLRRWAAIAHSANRTVGTS